VEAVLSGLPVVNVREDEDRAFLAKPCAVNFLLRDLEIALEGRCQLVFEPKARVFLALQHVQSACAAIVQMRLYALQIVKG